MKRYQALATFPGPRKGGKRKGRKPATENVVEGLGVSGEEASIFERVLQIEAERATFSDTGIGSAHRWHNTAL